MTTDEQTFTVGEGDDLVTYDVRGDLSSGRPLFMFGSPMDASGFVSLAAQFTDRPVVTYDPRGAGRNPKGTSDVPPQLHGADLHRVIEALDSGPVDIFASSGGAVNVLAMCAEHPDAVGTVVAHEPPVFVGLPDSETLLAAMDDMKATYLAKGNGPAMAKFIQIVMSQAELPADYLDQPDPDPAMFGQSAEDDGSRDNPLMRNMPGCNTYVVDVEALAPLGDRLFVAVGSSPATAPPPAAAGPWRHAWGGPSRTSRATTATSSTARTASRRVSRRPRPGCDSCSADRSG